MPSVEAGGSSGPPQEKVVLTFLFDKFISLITYYLLCDIVVYFSGLSIWVGLRFGLSFLG